MRLDTCGSRCPDAQVTSYNISAFENMHKAPGLWGQFDYGSNEQREIKFKKKKPSVIP